MFEDFFKPYIAKGHNLIFSRFKLVSQELYTALNRFFKFVTKSFCLCSSIPITAFRSQHCTVKPVERLIKYVAFLNLFVHRCGVIITSHGIQQTLAISATSRSPVPKYGYQILWYTTSKYQSWCKYKYVISVFHAIIITKYIDTPGGGGG